MPTELGTLDALHLATAVLWREMSRTDLVMATHDTALGLAARAHGFQSLDSALNGASFCVPNDVVMVGRDRR